MKLRLIWKKLDEREHKCGSRWIKLSSSVGPTWLLLLWLVMRLWKKFITSCSRDKRYVRFTWHVANLTSRQTQKGKGDGILPGGRGRSTILSTPVLYTPPLPAVSRDLPPPSPIDLSSLAPSSVSLVPPRLQILFSLSLVTTLPRSTPLTLLCRLLARRSWTWAVTSNEPCLSSE